MDVYHIIYSSIPNKSFSKGEIENLLIHSRQKNKDFNITGMLICMPSLFIQIIEGPKAEILQLYNNIEKDNRHYKVTLLKEGFIRKRYFPDWTMGLNYNDANLSDFAQTFSVYSEKVLSLFDIIDLP